LSLDDIVDRALQLATDVGFEKINIRALAGLLECAPMAIYGHVADKEVLLAAMADRAIGAIELPAAQDDWKDWYVEVALAFWSMMCRYPGLDAYVLTRGPVLGTPCSLAITTRMFETVLEYGFSAAQAATLWRTTHAYLNGHAMLARRGTSPRPSEAESSDSPASDVFAALSAPMDEGCLETGLRHILDGFTPGSH